MAVPWTDPTMGRGVYPAEAQFYVPQVNPYLAALIARQRDQQQQQISGAIQDALSSVGKYMEQRKQDQIANQLLAQANAPKATPVTPDTLYGEPSTALSADEMARNQALGFGTTPGQAPDLGGVQAYKMQLAAAENQAKLQALNALTGQREAQQAHLNRLGFGGTSTGGGTNRQYYDYTDPVTGQTIKVTGNRFTQLTNPPSGGRIAKDPWANLIPVARGRVNPDTGAFENNYTGAEQGDILQMRTPVGKTVLVPWAEYNKRSIAPRGIAQGDVNQAATVLNNETGLPAPDVPAAPDYSTTIPTTHVRTAPQAAIDYLKAHPETKDQFLAKYGYTP